MEINKGLNKINENTHNSIIVNENCDNEEETNKLHVVVKIEKETVNKHKILILLSLIAIIFEVYFYKLSLEGCAGTQTECLIKVNVSMMNRIMKYLSISSFLFSLILFLTINKILKFYCLLLQIIIFSYLILGYDTGSDLEHHGSYNSTYFIILLPIFLTLLYFIKLIVYLVKNRFYKYIIIGGIIILSIIPLIYLKLTLGCSERWRKGFYDKEVDNTKFPFNTCKLMTPKYCWIDLLDGVFDVSRNLFQDCSSSRKNERSFFLNFLGNDIDRKSLEYYYPITNLLSYIPESLHDRIYQNIKNRISIVNRDNNSEVLLKFNHSTDLGEITLSIKRNETLVKLRNEQTLKKTNPVKSKNILLIYIDSISRAHFKRKMKKTMEVLDKLLITTKKYSFYQFLKYQAFKYFTQININPMFYGKSMFTNSGTNILKEFHESGYISAHSNNFCSRELYDIEDYYNLNFVPFDHELVSLFCDSNYFWVDNPFTLSKGPYSLCRRCLYGKDTSNYVLDYGEKFWETYLGERKFLRLAFQDAHEGTGEVVKYLDENLAVFLEKFITKGWLEDTSIMFVSDHGNNMIGTYSSVEAEDFLIEKTLPTLNILLPSSFFKNSNINKDSFDQNMIFNGNIMVTPYDIYFTLLDLIGVERLDQNGQSLLSKIEDGDKRNCKKYEQDLDKEWCRCEGVK